MTDHESTVPYTVLVDDYSLCGASPSSPQMRAIQVEVPGPEHAAGTAEVVVALETWRRRYPDRGEPQEEHTPEGDADWIGCMESVSTIAVIEGWPVLMIGDDIPA